MPCRLRSLCGYCGFTIRVASAVFAGAGISASCSPISALAQQAPSAAAPERTSLASLPPPASLWDALHTLPFAWDGSEKGVLLYVALNPNAEPKRLIEPGAFRNTLLTASVKGYRLPDMAARFGRRVVSVGSVTTLVPTVTTVLATRLPAPDIYADLTTKEKVRLLEGTLTPSQWRLLASPNGLGGGDLQASQKALWASLLFNRLSLAHVQNKNGLAKVRFDRNEAPVLLSPIQRAGVRLTAYRTLSWSYLGFDKTNGDGSPFYVSSTASEAEGKETLALRETFRTASDAPENTLFGVLYKAVLPAKLKPSDLDYDNTVFDKSVSLGDAKTVGDLVTEIKIKTGIPIFCDPRYRSLAVWTRSDGQTDTARSGDVLKAVALSVAGTFRRVADDQNGAKTTDIYAYVLTDDLEGLGTRQARISEWAQAAVAQREAEQISSEAELAETRAGDYLQWLPGDPNKPSDELARRMEDYRNRKTPALDIEGKPGGDGAGLWVPVDELPLPLQNAAQKAGAEFQETVKRIQAQRAATGEKMGFEARLTRTDRVRLEVETGLAFLVPGVGRVEIGLQDGMTQPERLLQADARLKLRPVVKTPHVTKVAVTETNPFWFYQVKLGEGTAALLCSLPQKMSDISDIEEAVAFAKVHNCATLWLETPLGKETPKMLEQTIKAAKAVGLPVKVIVRVLRRPITPSETMPALPLDRNLLGETTTEWTARHAALPIGNNDLLSDMHTAAEHNLLSQSMGLNIRKEQKQYAERQQYRGDFLDIVPFGVEKAVLGDLLTLAQTPDLSGILVRDIPSSGGVSVLLNEYNRYGRNLAEEMGFTPAQRLRFLKETGTDPTDLSPVAQDNLFITFGTNSGGSRLYNIGLPQMPGGKRLEQGGADDSSHNLPGRGAGWDLWDTFREKETAAFWERLQKDYAAQSPPGVPLSAGAGKTAGR